MFLSQLLYLVEAAFGNVDVAVAHLHVDPQALHHRQTVLVVPQVLCEKQVGDMWVLAVVTISLISTDVQTLQKLISTFGKLDYNTDETRGNKMLVLLLEAFI